MDMMHDTLIPTAPAAANAGTWEVLIVDDEAAEHQAIVSAIADIPVHERPVHFLHAYSAEQAGELLRAQRDVAVVLLGRVLATPGGTPTPQAGLDLARTIRQELKRVDLRIVLRSDAADQMPTVDTIRALDISDCKLRAELSPGGLYATLAAAVRSYAQIHAFNVGRRGIDQIVHASARMMTHPRLRDFAAAIISEIAGLLQFSPEGIVCARDKHAGGDDLERHEGKERIDAANDERAPPAASPPGEAPLPIRIIAAAGRFAPYLDEPASALGNPALVALLTQSFREGRSHYGEQASVLFFAGESGNDLVAYIDAVHPLEEINRRLLEVFVANIASNLNNVELFERLHDQAYQDPLLRIPSRLAFMHAVGEALAERPQGTTVALIDIDHFSHLNDALGYRYGDTLLKAVALRLMSSLPAGTLVARLAADTFGVLGDGMSVAPQTLLPVFFAPFIGEATEQRLSATIGLVRLSEVDGNASDVIKSANIALNLAKRHRRGEGLYFVRRMEQETRTRMRLLRELRTAFDRRWLQVDYQPQVCLKTHRLIGVEALLRWRSDAGKGIAPGQFIQLAESSGLIVALGKWVLRTACEDLGKLLAQRADLCMSVNVSVVQFRHPEFIDGVDEILRESGIDPRRLELEITESVAMLDASYMLGTLNRIKKRGIAIAIDDFGTGFSSLSYLERLDVDRLKIDQSFVNQMMLSDSSLRIVETIVQLGHSLSLQVIAEGVEEAEQADVLRDIGCHAGQGYLFGRPMTLAQLRELLASMATSPPPAAGEVAGGALLREGIRLQ